MHYWGERSLGMIASILGNVIRVDNATLNKDKMQYACVLVEMNMKGDFNDTLAFTNEDDELVRVKVDYDWRPTICGICKQLGHTESSSRKEVTRQWVPKPKLTPQVDEEGFQMVQPKRAKKQIVNTPKMSPPDL